MKESESAGKEFMKLTSINFLEKTDQARGLPQPPLELPYDQERPAVDLPRPEDIKLVDPGLNQAIEIRRSVRQYSRGPLNLEELAYLLWCTQGVQKLIPGSATLRTVPSAGGRHALETYLLINRVESLTPGLYRYLALEHRLLQLSTDADLVKKLEGACLGQKMVSNAAAVFLWSAVPYRMTWRYGQRGYRYLHLDAGHACQNLYLSAYTVNCGVCAIAAFSDDDLNRVVGVDGIEEFVIYLATVGKLKGFT